MRSANLNIGFRLASQAVAPVNSPVLLGIDGCLSNGLRPLLSERAAEGTRALAGSTILGQTWVSHMKLATNPAGQSEHDSVRDDSSERRAHSYDGSDAIRHSDRCGTGKYPTQAVPDDVHSTARVRVCALDGLG